MRLPAKLSLLLLAAAALPLALVSAVTLPRVRAALRGQLDQIYAQNARALAEEVNRTIDDQLSSLTLAASTMPLSTLDPEARQAALLLIYRETRGADVVGLFDARGDSLGETIHFSDLSGELARDHESADDATLAAYARQVPLAGALQAGLAVGPVYVVPDAAGRPIPRVVLGVRLQEKRWVLAVEISLRRLADSFDSVRPGEQGAAVLTDSEGRIIFHPNPALVSARTRIPDQRPGEMLGATAPVPLLGWRVTVQQPAAEALRPLHHLQNEALLWLLAALLIALVGGLVLVRRVTEPLLDLQRAAEAVTGGALETEVNVPGNDELARLAKTFNAMVRGLREREGLKLGLALNESLQLSGVLDRLLDSLARVVPHDRAVVLMRTREGFQVAAARGLAFDEARRSVPDAEPVRRALDFHAPALSADRRQLALPLLHRSAVDCVVVLEAAQEFGDGSTRLALSLVQPAALAVENARLFDEVQRLATVDGLTGCANRRHFMELAQLAFLSARRFHQPLAALMLDVDHFKSINDRHGHAVGDQVLRALADRVRQTLRNIDLLGRYGGEEFAILLPGTDRASAAEVLAERLRARVADEPFLTDAGAVHVTVSAGVSGMFESTRDLPALLKRADAALYEAKQRGRNCVVEDGAPAARKPVA